MLLPFSLSNTCIRQTQSGLRKRDHFCRNEIQMIFDQTTTSDSPNKETDYCCT